MDLDQDLAHVLLDLNAGAANTSDTTQTPSILAGTYQTGATPRIGDQYQADLPALKSTQTFQNYGQNGHDTH